MRYRTTALGLLACAYACLQWLRWPEPPGFDQSLYTYYGHWLARGLALYRDLWDSKPPGLFAVYALAEPFAGPWHTARVLDALAALASAGLGFALVRALVPATAAGVLRSERTPGRPETTVPGDPLASRIAPWAAGFFVAFLPSAPCFGGPRTAGQPEILCAPFVLGALLVVRRATRRAAFGAGSLLGVAIAMKLVAAFLLPLLWIFAPRGRHSAARRSLEILAGCLLPLLFCGIVLAMQGALRPALEAVVLYPRAYAAELSGRIAFLPALARAGPALAGGVPTAIALGLFGVIAGRRSPLVHRALVFLALAVVGVLAQRQLVDYQLAFCVPPLALLAGSGAEAVLARIVALRHRSQRPGGGSPPAGRPFARLGSLALGAALVVVLGFDLGNWARGYATHARYRAGRMSREEFVLRLGRPGLAWQEALGVREILRARSPRQDGNRSILVWGFAPAVYALSGLPPATRYVFHQTLLVEGSALAQRWPDAGARRAELLERMQQAPPRFVVIVSGDRSALEPADSRRELADFPALAARFESEYEPIGTTRSYEVLERRRPGN